MNKQLSKEGKEFQAKGTVGKPGESEHVEETKMQLLWLEPGGSGGVGLAGSRQEMEEGDRASHA